MGQSGSAERYTGNYYQAVCCFAHTAHTAPLLHVLQVLHGMHHVHVVHHLRPLHPLHPLHNVHRCTRFSTAVRHLTRTVRARTDAMCEMVKQFRGVRPETAYALAALGARCRQSHRIAASGYQNLLLAPADRRDK